MAAKSLYTSHMSLSLRHGALCLRESQQCRGYAFFTFFLLFCCTRYRDLGFLHAILSFLYSYLNLVSIFSAGRTRKGRIPKLGGNLIHRCHDDGCDRRKGCLVLLLRVLFYFSFSTFRSAFSLRMGNH
ncbi:hypothetical protein V8C44DRAFT_188354 [Trichoderma aethiopicum]